MRIEDGLKRPKHFCLRSGWYVKSWWKT